MITPHIWHLWLPECLSSLFWGEMHFKDKRDAFQYLNRLLIFVPSYMSRFLAEQATCSPHILGTFGGAVSPQAARVLLLRCLQRGLFSGSGCAKRAICDAHWARTSRSEAGPLGLRPGAVRRGLARSVRRPRQRVKEGSRLPAATGSGEGDSVSNGDGDTVTHTPFSRPHMNSNSISHSNKAGTCNIRLGTFVIT